MVDDLLPGLDGALASLRGGSPCDRRGFLTAASDSPLLSTSLATLEKRHGDARSVVRRRFEATFGILATRCRLLRELPRESVCVPRILTLGHSNRPLAAFLAILAAHRIDRILDVRRYPVSRKWPHFDAEPLAKALAEAGIAYTGLPELGGRRKARPGSRHRAWREESFRGYADFMDTPEFEAGLSRVLDLAKSGRPALMCAEAVPWRCHRSLIADALVAQGIEVVDVMSETSAREHALPVFARVENGRVVYDVGELPL